MPNPDVTEYIEKIDQPWQAEVCQALRQLIHQSVPDVAERLQYKKPHYLKNGSYLSVVGTAKAWVSFTIFNAAGLEAPAGLFESGPPERKTIKIRERQDVDYNLPAKFVEQAARTM